MKNFPLLPLTATLCAFSLLAPLSLRADVAPKKINLSEFPAAAVDDVVVPVRARSFPSSTSWVIQTGKSNSATGKCVLPRIALVSPSSLAM